MFTVQGYNIRAEGEKTGRFEKTGTADLFAFLPNADLQRWTLNLELNI
jgi:hypothetical protein